MPILDYSSPRDLNNMGFIETLKLYMKEGIEMVYDVFERAWQQFDRGEYGKLAFSAVDALNPEKAGDRLLEWGPYLIPAAIPPVGYAAAIIPFMILSDTEPFKIDFTPLKNVNAQLEGIDRDLQEIKKMLEEVATKDDLRRVQENLDREFRDIHRNIDEMRDNEGLKNR